ncbi:MAG: hypothetical protein AMXMBFR82_37980 [Candidatus Hydrogenedentota bacterium]
MHEAQSCQPVHAAAIGAQIGDEHGPRVADHDDLDMSPPVDKNADLALNLAGEFSQGAGKFGADDTVCRNSSVGELLQALMLGRFEPVRISYDANGRPPKRNAPELPVGDPGAGLCSSIVFDRNGPIIEA